MLEHHPKGDEVPPMKGSVIIAIAESAEAVREQLCKDIYAKTGVWDVDNVNFLFSPVYSPSSCNLANQNSLTDENHTSEFWPTF